MIPDNFIELAKLCQVSFSSRQTYEWKVNFGLWSSIGIWTYFCLSDSILFSERSIFTLSIVYLLVVIFYILFWQFSIRKGFEKDKQWKHFYMHSAEGLNPPRPGTPKLKDLGWNQWSFILSQTGVTIALLVASLILISFSKPVVNSIKQKSSPCTIVLPDSCYQVVITCAEKPLR